MREFNAGDRVKLVAVDDQDESVGLKVGMIGTVKNHFHELIHELIIVEFDNWGWGFGENKSRWQLLDFQIEKLEGESK